MERLKLFIILTLLLTSVCYTNIAAQRILPSGRNEIKKSKPIKKRKQTKNNIVRDRIKQNNRNKAPKVKLRKKKKRKEVFIYKENNRPSAICRTYEKKYLDGEEYFYDEDSNTETNLELINDNELISIYPDFPLRLVDGEISYLFTTEVYNNFQHSQLEDIYKLKFSIKVTSDDYVEPFAVLIKYYDGTSQLEIFNEEKSILDWGNIYTFDKDITIAQTGYINLRIGYYNSEEELFYPCKFIPQKTDLLIYINEVSVK